MVNETHKILDKSIALTATAVRIPIEGGHCESVNITFLDSFAIKDIYEILNTKEGLKVVDDVDQNSYPMPINTKGKDDVFVGRIRKDYSQKNSLNLWIVADNLRKGAATNTVQIAEYMIRHDLL